jgi:hypothetical protein
MKNYYSKVLSCIVAFAALLCGQAVTFSNPGAWMTLRDKNVIASSQVDTAKCRGKKIKINLVLCDGAKEKIICSKNYPITDYSQKFELCSPPRSVIGGSSFLRINWDIAGTDSKGVIEPIGLAALNADNEKITLEAKKIAGAMTIAGLNSTITQGAFISVGNQKASIVWNDQFLGLLCKKSTDNSKLLLSIDGKNGKNSFLSFPDRFIAYHTQGDSVLAQYFKRIVEKNSVQYLPQVWINEIKKYTEGDFVLLTIPWYDLGIIPSEGRIMGFGLFSMDAQDKVLQSFPEQSAKDIPGTWGNLKIVGIH